MSTADVCPRCNGLREYDVDEGTAICDCTPGMTAPATPMDYANALLTIDCLHDRVAALTAVVADLQGLRQGWQPIETAPKDGTRIFIYRADWDKAPVAMWGEYPANPVLSDDEQEVCMDGWLLDDEYHSCGHEDGWLGWNDDPMPTHWMPLPPPPADSASQS